MPTVPIAGLIEGRSVHYIAYNGRHLAAIVIGGDFASGVVNLVVFSDMANVKGQVNFGVQFQAGVGYSDNLLPGTWHWIERV